MRSFARCGGIQLKQRAPSHSFDTPLLRYPAHCLISRLKQLEAVSYIFQLSNQVIQGQSTLSLVMVFHMLLQQQDNKKEITQVNWITDERPGGRRQGKLKRANRVYVSL